MAKNAPTAPKNATASCGTEKRHTKINFFFLKKKLFACWVIFPDFLLSANFFFQISFFKNYFRNITRVLNSLDPDQT